MFVFRRAVALACTLALLSAPAASATRSPAASVKGGPAASASKKRCRKGYRLRTVRKHGKRVRVCRRVRKGKPAGPLAPPLFEPPGHQLVGNEAVPFLQRYLYNSRFTTCPAGWPNCGTVEERYSHFAEGFMYYCRLGPTPGSDINAGPMAYQVKNAVVEADGAWKFNEEVNDYGNPAFYEWQVSTDGVVYGAYQFNGGAIEQLGPFQYVAGARDCSY